jgi:2-polyprenyl-3-methyl-5-hydroxy-6-metoxy-1,4-benzoquinol methylase
MRNLVERRPAGSDPRPPSRAKERVAGGLYAVGLLRPVTRLRERYLARRAQSAPTIATNGLPLPPARLRVLVDGRSGDADRFIRVGQLGARTVREVLADVDVDLATQDRILDFGCGCGRVARHWGSLGSPEINGCDYNAELVHWCQENLPFMKVRVNELDPPSRYASGSFDVVYALSVFTHLPEALQQAWVAELRRILRPGGVLLLTTLGVRFTYRLSAEGRAEFEAGRIVIQRPRLAGENLCIALHPEPYVRQNLLADFSVLAMADRSSDGMFQDVYVARRT